MGCLSPEDGVGFTIEDRQLAWLLADVLPETMCAQPIRVRMSSHEDCATDQVHKSARFVYKTQDCVYYTRSVAECQVPN
jgi:hypothetical protein